MHPHPASCKWHQQGCSCKWLARAGLSCSPAAAQQHRAVDYRNYTKLPPLPRTNAEPSNACHPMPRLTHGLYAPTAAAQLAVVASQPGGKTTFVLRKKLSLMSGLRANSGLSKLVGGVKASLLVVSWPPRLRSCDSMVRFLVSRCVLLQAGALWSTAFSNTRSYSSCRCDTSSRVAGDHDFVSWGKGVLSWMQPMQQKQPSIASRSGNAICKWLDFVLVLHGIATQ